MPFTPSHVAAILPLVGGRRARWFDAAALTIGAMVPDLPYFVPLAPSARWTHASFGPPTMDLALGLVVLGVWRLASPVVRSYAPDWLRRRTPPELVEGPRTPTPRELVEGPRRGWRTLAPAALSLVVGATTHVVWDSFSHPRRWGSSRVAWLGATHGPLAGYQWVQYGSGALGLVVLGLWFVRWVGRTPPHPARSAWPSARARHQVWAAALVALGVTVGLTWAHGAAASGAWLDERTAVLVAEHAITACLVVLLLAAVARVLWWDGSRHGRPAAHHPARPQPAAPGAAGGDRRDGRA